MSSAIAEPTDTIESKEELEVIITAEICSISENSRGSLNHCLVANAGIAAAQMFDPDVNKAEVRLLWTQADIPPRVNLRIFSNASPYPVVFEHKGDRLGNDLINWDDGEPPPLGTYSFTRVQ